MNLRPPALTALLAATILAACPDQDGAAPGSDTGTRVDSVAPLDSVGDSDSTSAEDTPPLEDTLDTEDNDGRSDSVEHADTDSDPQSQSESFANHDTDFPGVEDSAQTDSRIVVETADAVEDSDTTAVDTDMFADSDSDPTPSDTDTLGDTEPAPMFVPPPHPPGCLIPAPGSWASRGALSTNHLPNAVRVANASNSMWWSADASGDGVPEAIVSQVGMVPTLDLANADIGQDRISFINIASVTGIQTQAESEWRYLFADWQWPVAEVRAPPADLNGDGRLEILGYVRDETYANSYAGSTDVDGLAGGTLLQSWNWILSKASDVSYNLRTMQTGDWNADGASDLYVQGVDTLGRTRGIFLSGPIVNDVAVQPSDPYEFARLEEYSHQAHPDSVLVADFDGDGYDDLAINDWTPPTSGAVRLWFGPLSGVLNQAIGETTFLSTQPNRYKSFGIRMDRVGDINGDGFEDLVIPDFDATWAGLNRVGVAHVFLGPFARGATYRDTDAYAHIHWVHPEAFVSRVTGLGDVDGNGTDDFAVVVQNALTTQEPVDHRVPLAPLPPGIEPDPVCVPAANEPPAGELPVDTAPPACLPPDPNAFILYEVESAIMVFSNPQPGDLGPHDALFTIKGDRPGANVGLEGLIGDFDLDGDGFQDIAFTSWNLRPEGYYEQTVHVVKPCGDFGQRVLP